MSHSSELSNHAKARTRVATELGLERATVDAVLAAATVRHFRRGTAIYPQGTHRGSIFVVLAGEVGVSVILPDGQRILCVIYQPGTVFGFPIVEGERPRLSAADAFTPATVAVVPRREFERILASLPPAAVIRFFNRVLERQARFAMRLVYCTALDLRGRLALTIGDLAATFGVREAGGVRISIPVTHENLADMVGASRERISKAMAGLMADRVITYRRQAVTVVEAARLHAAATPSG